MQPFARHGFVARRAKLALVTSVILASLCLPAFADDLDPFQLETTHWMSFERYKEKAKSGAIPAKEETTDAAPVVTPPVMATKTAVAVPAAPSRPLNLPVMPGLSAGYNLHVSTTDDDRKSTLPLITNLDTTPTLALPPQNWQSAVEAARQNAANQKNEDDDGEDNRAPINVRLSFLPNSKIAPAPEPERKSNHGRAPNALAAAHASPVPETPKKSPAEMAACAAIDAYKKKQLEAIQSDRQTLEALQAAIAQLGLQKQLDFIPGATSSLSSQARSASARMDYPISTPATIIK